MTYKPIKNIDELVEITQFKELYVAEKRTILDIESFTPTISNIRNITNVAGSATISQAGGEVALSTTANGADSVSIESATRGVYEAGRVAQAGLGVRIPSQTYSGTQAIEWGYFTEDNGFLFGRDATGNYVQIISGGVSREKTYQTNWNVDTLDGSGDADNPSGALIDMANGEIFSIDFVYYGYGTVEFAVKLAGVDLADGAKPVVVHRFTTSAGVSVQVPNLPLRMRINNNGAANAITAYLGGRQFSLLGGYKPSSRITSTYRGSVAVGTTAWIPLISFKKKAGETNLAQNVRIAKASVVADQNIIVGFVSGGTLTGATFATPNMVNSASETVLESDVSATAITGGEFVGLPILIQASNKGEGQSSELAFDFTIPNTDNLTMIARAVTTGGNAQASFLSLSEEW